MKRLTQVLMLFLGVLAISISTQSTQAQSAVFYEDFEGTFPPTGWTTIDNAGNGGNWLRSDATGEPNEITYFGTTASGHSAAADPDALGTSYAWDADLITPPIDLTSLTTADLEFESNFQDYAGNGDAYVDITTNGGTSWTNIWSRSTDQSSSGEFMSFNIGAYTGNTIQVRFTYQCTSNTTWYWHIDNVSIVTTLPLDAGMISIDGPAEPATPGANNVEATIQNFGSNTLTSATVNWSVNGTVQAPYSWSGSLANGATDGPLTLGSANFVSGMNEIAVWSSNPNGSADPNPANDTAKASILACNPLTGSYTIGAGGDFPTFSSAVNALEQCGVGGPVTFIVNSGTYNEQITLQEITGMSATNTVTFQSQTGNAADVTLNYAPTGYSENWTVNLDGGDYFRFMHLTIQSDPTNTSGYSRVFELDNGADNNIIDNCIINGQENPSTSSDYYALIYIDGSGDASYTAITNNTFNNGSYGIHYYTSSTSLSPGNVISGNTFNGFGYRGIYLYGHEAIVVESNTLTSHASPYSSLYGIYLSSCDLNSQVNSNKIMLTGSSSSYGIYATSCEGAPGQEMLIANNYVLLNGGTSTLYGIYTYNGMDQQIYYNTVSILTGSGGTLEYAFYANSSSSGSYGNIDVKNNIFMNSAGGYAVYISSGAASLPYISAMDYNNLFSPAGNVGRQGTTDAATLGSWRTLSGFDANSVGVDPVLSSNTDPTPVAYTMDDKGTPVAAVLTDINGAVRNATTPDIGCVEFTAPTNAIMVLSETTHDFGFFEAGQTRSFTLYIDNVGATPLTVISNSVNAPFSCDLNAKAFVTINPGQRDSCTVTFAPTAAGTYNETLNFVATTSVLNLSVDLSGAAYAAGTVIEDFEGPVFPPDGWTLASPDGQNWQSTTSMGHGATEDHTSGSGKMASLDDSSPDNSPKDLITPPLDFTYTPNPELRFWYWIGEDLTDLPSYLIIDVFDGTVWHDSVLVLAPNAMWSEATVNLSPYVSNQSRIRFRAIETSTFYSDISIDDIYHPPLYVFPYDVKVTKVSDDANVFSGDSYNYMVEVENKGSNNDVYNLSLATSKAFTYAIRDKNDASTISTLSLNAGELDTVLVKATVPAGTAHEDEDIVKFFAASQAQPSESDSTEFTTTAVVPLIPPYFQDFTNYSYGPFERWMEATGVLANPTVFGSTTSSSWSSEYFGNDNSHPNGDAARLNIYYSFYSGGNDDWLISPLLDLGAKANYQLEFDLALTDYYSTSADDLAPGDTFAVVISTDGGMTWNKSDTLKVWSSDDTISATGEHQTIDLSAYSGLIRIGFYGYKAISGGDINVYVDNFAILDPTAVPGCVTPINPTDTAKDVDAPVLDLEWTMSPNTTGYKVYFGTTNPPTTFVDVGDTTGYQATGLAFNTDYFWKVVPYNINGDATGCPVWTFKTYSNPTVTSYPWYETFEANFTPGSPGTFGEAWITTQTGDFDWRVNDGGTTSSSTGPSVDHTTGTSSGIYLYTEASSPASAGDVATVQRDLIDLSAATSSTLSFWYHMYGSTMGDLFIDVFSGGSWNTVDSLIGEQQTSQSDPWLMKEIDLSAFTGDTISVRFRAIRGSSYYGDMAIDDIGILVNGITGTTVYANTATTPVGGVDVALNPGSLTTVSNDLGAFGFMPVANGSYTIDGTATLPTGGINTTDALLAIRNYVGIMTLNALETAAADVTDDGAVNANDALQIQRYYVELITGFTAPMWQFETGNVTVNNDIASVMLYGLATGDVNASYTPGVKAANNVLLFDAEPMTVDAHTEIDIPVYAAQAMRLGAMSLEINYPAGKLEITDVRLANNEQEVIWAAANGKLRISWFSENAIEAIPGSAIFTITAMASPYENISFETGPTSEFADDAARVIDNAAISMPKLTVTGIPEELALSAYPNPSSGMTNVTYDITKSGMVSLKLYNSLGELVSLLVNDHRAAGSYQVSFDASNLPAGIYVGQLELNGMSSASRIVIQH